MARKLASAVALITMAVSATALALGLGDMKTGSALNQAFEAEVELLGLMMCGSTLEQARELAAA